MVPSHLLLAIAIGGALGALGRFLIAEWVYHHLGRLFPYGTLAVNVIGSFLIGFLAVLMVERFEVGPFWRGLLIVGFLGAFTTFSTFALDAFYLAHRAEWLGLVLYVFLSVTLCLFAVTGGVALGHLHSWHPTFPYGVLLVAAILAFLIPWGGLLIPQTQARFLLTTSALGLLLLLSLLFSTWRALETAWLGSWIRWAGLLFANLMALSTAAAVGLLLATRYLGRS